MKSKHYIWTFALLGLTACGSEADSVMLGVVEEKPIQVIPNKNIPIQFGLSEQAITRADTVYYVEGHQKNVIPAGRKVGVFGCYQGYEVWNINNGADFFYNEPMTVETPLENSRATYLTYNPLRFWPNGNEDGKEEMLSFYAYYPYVKDDAAATQLGLKLSKEEFLKGQGEFVFTCKDKASEQIDFMVSTLNKDQKRSDYLDGDKRVPMTFYHQLSRILININIDPATEIKNDSVVTKPRVYVNLADDDRLNFNITMSGNSEKVFYDLRGASGTLTLENFNHDNGIWSYSRGDVIHFAKEGISGTMILNLKGDNIIKNNVLYRSNISTGSPLYPSVKKEI